MTAERVQEIAQFLECCRRTDATEADSEKSFVIGELLEALTERRPEEPSERLEAGNATSTPQ